MIVLDTDVVSELMRGRPDQGVVAWVRSLSPAEAFTTAVTARNVADFQHVGVTVVDPWRVGPGT